MSLCENMTSSRKPEVHIVLQRRQRIEPRPYVTCTGNFAEARTCGFRDMRYAGGQADRRTDALQYFGTLPGAK